MSGINTVGNLQRSGVKPLRPVSGAAQQDQVVQRFEVDGMRSGTTVTGPDAHGGAGQHTSVQPQYLRDKLQIPKARETSRQSANANLTDEEKREKLEKIHNASQQYEAIYVDHFLKQMRQSPFAKMPGGELYQDIAEMPMRDYLSGSGALGLSGAITEQVARDEGLDQFLHDNPGIAGPGYRPKTLKANMSKGDGLSIGRNLNNLNTEMLVESQRAAVKTILGQGAKTGENASASEAKTEAPAATGQPQEAKIAMVGLMNHEEIAYLYEDARLSLL